MGLWVGTERDATLRRLFADGLTGSQIAAQIGGGTTKNAVIGRWYRIGLSRSAEPPSFEERMARIEVFDAPGKCLYGIGNPDKPEFHFCGAPGSPYCAKHAAKVYTKLPPPAGQEERDRQERWGRR